MVKDMHFYVLKQLSLFDQVKMVDYMHEIEIFSCLDFSYEDARDLISFPATTFNCGFPQTTITDDLVFIGKKCLLTPPILKKGKKANDTAKNA